MWDRFIGAHFLENVTKGPRNGNPGGHGQWQTERWYPSGAPQNNQRERRRRRKKDIYTQRYRKERCGFAQGCGIVFRRSFFSRKRRGCYNVDDSIFGRLFRPGLSGNILFGIDRKKKKKKSPPDLGKNKIERAEKTIIPPLCAKLNGLLYDRPVKRDICVSDGKLKDGKTKDPKDDPRRGPKKENERAPRGNRRDPKYFFYVKRESEGTPKKVKRKPKVKNRMDLFLWTHLWVRKWWESAGWVPIGTP